MASPPAAPSRTSGLVEAYLIAGRAHLLTYVESRVNDPQLADDVVQESLLKALRAAPDLRDEERLVPWFRRIVDHAIADAYRERARRGAVVERLQQEGERLQQEGMLLAEPTPAEEEALCLCFRALLPTLKDEYRVLIEALELEERDPDTVARELGITRNNLNVRRHRARRQLRERLEALCTACPTHGFHACDCPSARTDAGASAGRTADPPTPPPPLP